MELTSRKAHMRQVVFALALYVSTLVRVMDNVGDWQWATHSTTLTAHGDG